MTYMREAIRDGWVGIEAHDQASTIDAFMRLQIVVAKVKVLILRPLTEHVLLDDGTGSWLTCNGRNRSGAEDEHYCCDAFIHSEGTRHYRGIDWVIVGGGVGPDARPLHPEWVRSIRKQCQAFGVPFFFEGWGDWVPTCQFHSWTYYWNKAPNRDFDRLLALDGFESRFAAPYENAAYPLAGFKRVGKEEAGRELDGREWLEMPQLPAMEVVSER